jgi:hypothetical protein
MTCTTADSRQALEPYKHQPWCDRHQHALVAEDAGGYWPHCIGRIIKISSEVVGWWQVDEDAGNQPRFHVDLVRGADLDEDALRAVQALFRDGYGDQLLRLIARGLADFEDGIPAGEQA